MLNKIKVETVWYYDEPAPNKNKEADARVAQLYNSGWIETGKIELNHAYAVVFKIELDEE